MVDAFCHAHSDPDILIMPIRTLKGCAVACVSQHLAKQSAMKMFLEQDLAAHGARM